jgi:hypothetical protein
VLMLLTAPKLNRMAQQTDAPAEGAKETATA